MNQMKSFISFKPYKNYIVQILKLNQKLLKKSTINTVKKTYMILKKINFTFRNYKKMLNI